MKTRKLLILLLALLMLPAAAFTEDDNEDPAYPRLYYDGLSGNRAVIVSYYGKETDLAIPEKLNGRTESDE